MARLLVLGFALTLAACGGGGESVRSANVQFGDPGDGNLGFTSNNVVIIRDDLFPHDMIRVLQHELMHVAGQNGHPAEANCIADATINTWPEQPCQSDLEFMARNLPSQAIRLIVMDPGLWQETLQAATFWNTALNTQAFSVHAGY